MFIVSFKTDKKKVIIGLALAVLAVTLLLVALKLGGGGGEAAPFDCRAGTNEERLAFLHQFGWEAETEPAEINEVTIPLTFDDVYQKYNTLQKSQGLDLTGFAGKTCRQFIYNVTNYPGGEAVRATLLVLEGRVVGGDLSSTAIDGFMCGFYGQTNGSASSQGSSSAVSALPEASSSAASGAQSSEAPAESGASKAESAASSTASEKASSKASSKAASSSEIPANAWPTD